MRCRKRRDEVETGGSRYPGRVWRGPDYWPGGLRHEGGVNLMQALVWNVGTCRPDVKGAAQVETPREPEYRGGAQGRSHL